MLDWIRRCWDRCWDRIFYVDHCVVGHRGPEGHWLLECDCGWQAVTEADPGDDELDSRVEAHIASLHRSS